MDVIGALFALADLLMIFAGFTYGWKFIRNHGNYLLGLEWIIVATSGVNFLIYAVLRLSQESGSFHVAIFFDAFSRSVGITLILVLGSSLAVHSALRLVRQAAREGKPAVIVTDGPTRADDLATVRVVDRVAPFVADWRRAAT